MVRVTPRGPGAATHVPSEKDIFTASVERPWRAPDDGALATEDDFTVVRSRKERRRQQKETADPQKATKEAHSPSVELPRCAPDGGARTRVPPQKSLPLTATRVEDEDEDRDRRNDTVSQREDQDQDMDPVGTFAEWRLMAIGEFTTRYQAVSWLESVRGLSFSVRVSSSDFYVKAKTLETACKFVEIESEKPGGLVIVKCEKEERGVVLGFPVHLPLDAIVEHPCVRKAERCFFNAGRGRRLPTRSVQVTWRGTLPKSLDLGCWGRYACRRYVPEPLRCFRCQAYGHHQRSCPRTDDLCGACGRNHSTRECLLRRREGEDTAQPWCINCGARHYAWYRRCPARLRRIPGAVLSLRVPQRRWGAPVESSLPTTTTTTAAASATATASVGRVGQKTATPPSASMSEPGGAGLPEGNRRRGRRQRHRRRRGRAPQEPVLPPSLPRVEEATLTRPPLKTPQSSQGERLVDAATQTEEIKTAERPPTEGKKTKETASQTLMSRCLVFKANDLQCLLERFEHLVAQETEAHYQHISHEPALHCAQRYLEKGDTVLPLSLPMSRPLKNKPNIRITFMEREWVDYSDGDTDTDTEEEETDGRKPVATQDCSPTVVESPVRTRSQTQQKPAVTCTPRRS